MPARRDEARKLLANGVDPSENKKAVKVEQEQEAITFEVVARDWHASNQKWSASHSARVLKSLEDNLHRIDHYSGRPLTRLAVELTLLVFIRSSELRFARWSEVDFDTAMWTIPGEREPLEGVKHSQRGSKMRTPHLVPLSRQALAILEKIKSMNGNRELIFVGDHDPRKPMSENTVNKALRVMGYDTRLRFAGMVSGLWHVDGYQEERTLLLPLGELRRVAWRNGCFTVQRLCVDPTVYEVADFNDEDKLGKGKEMIDRLSKLVAIFEGLDLSANRVDGDDLLGDAYEYLMRHFATESGKSKGQFYTPAEVSRILAKVIGISKETPQDATVYDPGQEMDYATSALARMNMILHDNATAKIWKGNTLADPHWKDGNDNLKTFDRVIKTNKSPLPIFFRIPIHSLLNLNN
ncbi:type I restriction-modification system, M subunit [Klebsiella pneumoniae RYC492]|nr:type I restriction-modification system, M subunit [Klebsiella pneumoniae RYC492]